MTVVDALVLILRGRSPSAITTTSFEDSVLRIRFKLT